MWLVDRPQTLVGPGDRKWAQWSEMRAGLKLVVNQSQSCKIEIPTHYLSKSNLKLGSLRPSFNILDSRSHTLAFWQHFCDFGTWNWSSDVGIGVAVVI